LVSKKRDRAASVPKQIKGQAFEKKSQLISRNNIKKAIYLAKKFSMRIRKRLLAMCRIKL